MAVGYVYLMTNGKDYKIGLTASDPEDRKRQLQTGSSEQISLIAYTICKDMNGLENKLHAHFSSKRKSGEWFALSEDNLHHIYLVFKEESINLSMTYTPEVLSKDIDKLMKIDGKRLARGEDTLHDEKYVHIPDYKEIVIDHMHEEEKNFVKKKQERYEALCKEEEEEYHLEELAREDAKRIAHGGKPLHTFEYKKLDHWKAYLKEQTAMEIKKKKELENENRLS